MSGRRLLFDTLYRLGRPIWDTSPPEQSRDAVEGTEALSPGHALDVGCGTGTDVIYLATHGRRAGAVDFPAAAMRSPGRTADGVAGATFLEGDVIKLSQLPLEKLFSIERTEPKNFTIELKLLRHNIPGHWYWLRHLGYI